MSLYIQDLEPKTLSRHHRLLKIGIQRIISRQNQINLTKWANAVNKPTAMNSFSVIVSGTTNVRFSIIANDDGGSVMSYTTVVPILSFGNVLK